ncbi:hypothetical protein BH10BAC5_BH10BAC5_11770 [soil metagenome]
MCEAEMRDPTVALEGYEFVSEFHPDPTMRLLATWDAQELDDILTGGNGVSRKENFVNIKRLSKYEIEKLKDQNANEMIKSFKDFQTLEKIYQEEILNKNLKPVKEVIKSAYQKISVNNETLQKNSGREKDGKQKLGKEEYKMKSFVKNYLDNRLIQRSNVNRKQKWTFNKEAKEKQQLQDFLLIAGIKSNGNLNSDNAGIVTNYSLSQNYPNPFNPVTNIKYTIPKAGLVTIKVYDVLGRMINELVHEVKDTGEYTVRFEGSGFASGVYFYRLESKEFISTNRMVLVK